MGSPFPRIVVARHETGVVGGHGGLQAEGGRHAGRTVEEGEFALVRVIGQKADLRPQVPYRREQGFVVGKGIDRVAGDVDTDRAHFDDVTQVLHVGRVDAVIGKALRRLGPYRVRPRRSQLRGVSRRDDRHVPLVESRFLQRVYALDRSHVTDIRKGGRQALQRFQAGVIAVVVGQEHVVGLKRPFVQRRPAMDEAVRRPFVRKVGIDLDHRAVRVLQSE